MANNPKHKDNLKPFKKGDPRINRSGRPPELIETIIKAGKDQGLDIEDILKKLWKMGKAGDIKAIDMILNRVYGGIQQNVKSQNTNTVEVKGISNKELEEGLKDE